MFSVCLQQCPWSYITHLFTEFEEHGMKAFHDHINSSVFLRMEPAIFVWKIEHHAFWKIGGSFMVMEKICCVLYKEKAW